MTKYTAVSPIPSIYALGLLDEIKNLKEALGLAAPILKSDIRINAFHGGDHECGYEVKLPTSMLIPYAHRVVEYEGREVFLARTAILSRMLDFNIQHLKVGDTVVLTEALLRFNRAQELKIEDVSTTSTMPIVPLFALALGTFGMLLLLVLALTYVKAHNDYVPIILWCIGAVSAYKVLAPTVHRIKDLF